VNKVLLTGRLTRDPEMRSLSSGKTVTQFSIATNEYIGQGKEKAEYQSIVEVYRIRGLLRDVPDAAHQEES
jgi:single-stranded DNA-binding protein